jgi:hypothetical protein
MAAELDASDATDAAEQYLRSLYPRDQTLSRPVFALWPGKVKSHSHRQQSKQSAESKQTRAERHQQQESDHEQAHQVKRAEQVWQQTLKYHEWLCHKAKDSSFHLPPRQERAMVLRERQYARTRRDSYDEEDEEDMQAGS